MQHRGAHVGQCAELPVADVLYRLRIIDDPRVGRHQTGDIRPVLIQIRMQCARGKTTSDIRTAS